MARDSNMYTKSLRVRRHLVRKKKFHRHVSCFTGTSLLMILTYIYTNIHIKKAVLHLTLPVKPTLWATLISNSRYTLVFEQEPRQMVGMMLTHAIANQIKMQLVYTSRQSGSNCYWNILS